MNSFRKVIVLCFLAACSNNVSPDNLSNETVSPYETGGSEGSTFNHDNTHEDAFELLDRYMREGPSSYSARMHGCTKVRYETIANILKTLGVDMQNSDSESAGQLHASGSSALGKSNYAFRVRENINVTASSASRLFDIFAQAAPEIIANFSTLKACEKDGSGIEFFTESGQCSVPAITCLIGVPATATHLDICNRMIESASNPEVGRQLAVATLLAAAYTCE